MKQILLIVIVNLICLSLSAQTNMKVQSGKAELALTIYNSAKPETIILLHGGPGAPHNFSAIVEQLKSKYRIINFDQRGLGESTCNNCKYTMEEYMGDINTIMDHFGLDKVHLYGHSWGGLYAQIYAQKHPDNIASLFLCSPGSGTGEQWKATQKAVMQFNKTKATDKEWRQLGWNSLKAMLGSDKGIQDMYRLVVQNYQKGYPVNDSTSQFDFSKIKAKPTNKTLKNIRKYPELEKMENTNFPVMVTYGEEDIYGDTDEFVYERFPNADFKTIPNSGHLPWDHNPKEFNAILKEFYEIK